MATRAHGDCGERLLTVPVRSTLARAAIIEKAEPLLEAWLRQQGKDQLTPAEFAGALADELLEAP